MYCAISGTQAADNHYVEFALSNWCLMDDQEDPEFKAIREAVFARHVPPLRKKIFHTGVIVLVALLIGLLAFQFVEAPPDVSPQAASTLRLGWGLMAGIFLSIVGVAAYIFWLFVRLSRARREATTLISQKALERLKGRR